MGHLHDNDILQPRPQHFLGKLGLSLFKPRRDYQILYMKGKT